MFHIARIKLTAWYLLIIMCVSLSFSVVIYKVLTREVERFARAQRFRIEHPLPSNFTPPGEIMESGYTTNNRSTIDPDLIAETNTRIIWSLFTLNGIIIIISGGLSYFLAGRTLDPIRVMLEEQNQFISDASHELRTPLTSLKSAMEVSLRDKNLTLVQSKKIMAENIIEVNNLQALSDSLLQLAQVQTPHAKQLFESVDIQKVIKEAVDKTSVLSKDKNITIKSNIHSSTVLGNPYSLNDLFVILLDNAIKYSAKNKEITIETNSKDGNTIIRIIDHGIGISEHDLPHIFDRFYRADAARTNSSTQGYGLGLSIAKQIVRMHGGTIVAASALKKGTTMIVSLPQKHSQKIITTPIDKYFS